MNGGVIVGEKKVYDLAERTARLGEAVIRLAKKVPKDTANLPLIRQIVRAGTSVGANLCEANEAVSRKEFRNKIGICRKEASETKYWLRMIAVAEPPLKDEARRLWKESHELTLIFAKSFRTAGEPKEE